MTRTKKRVLAFLAFFAPVYIVLFVIGMFVMTFGLQFANTPEPAGAESNPELAPVFLGLFGVVFLLHFGAIVSVLGQVVYYALHVSKNEALDSNQRMAWMLGLLMLNMFAVVAYYWKHIRPLPIEPGAGVQSERLAGS